MNYEDDMKIDESALDVEWLGQSSLMVRYVKLCAKAHLDMDLEQEKLNLVKSDLDYKIRLNPADYGISSNVKITEAVIFGTILQQDEYQEANKQFLLRRYEYETIKGTVTAVEHRKTALENLVKLFGQQYFAGPSVPRDISKEWIKKQTQESVDAGVSVKLNRTK